MTMAMKAQSLPGKRFPLDPWVTTSALILLVIGLLMVASASTEIAAKIYGNPLHLLIKHLVYILISLAFAMGALMVPIRLWQKADRLLLFLCFALLIAVLIPGVGHRVNGSTRWISLGFFTLQGSEFVKLFVVVYISGYLVRRQAAFQSTVMGFLMPLMLVGVMAGLLLIQPDFGAAVVIFSAAIGMVYLAGVPFKGFLALITVSLVAVAAIAQWQPYRLARLTTFTDPWAHKYDSGYQLTQALIAFGRGEWFGLGLGNSIQKLFFLPEAHTDFLLSIVAEEWGVIGTLVVILAFTCLVIKGLWIGRAAHIRGYAFHAYLAYGIVFLLGVQAAINIGVNIGLLPTKGLTLPLVSYGGNSLIVSCLLVAILLRVDFESRNPQLLKSPGAKYRGA